MKEIIRILGIRIDNFSREEIEAWLKKMLDNPPEQKFIATLNPEIILKGHCDESYTNILNSADLNLCDGFGVKLISWLKGNKIKSRYTGVDLTDFLVKRAKEKNFSALVAVAPNSLSHPEEIERGMEDKYNFKVRAKYQDGEKFFESEEAKKAEIVFVNCGAPAQEKYIFENRSKFPSAKILIGVGGTFDFLTGKMKRAPEWMQKLGLEWFFRFLQEPQRAKRIWNAIVVFSVLAVLAGNKKKDS